MSAILPPAVRLMLGDEDRPGGIRVVGKAHREVVGAGDIVEQQNRPPKMPGVEVAGGVRGYGNLRVVRN